MVSMHNELVQFAHGFFIKRQIDVQIGAKQIQGFYLF
jgi:hypothetical protein